MTDSKTGKWQGLDVVVDTDVPAGYAQLRDKDGNVVVTLKLDGRHLAIAPTDDDSICAEGDDCDH